MDMLVVAGKFSGKLIPVLGPLLIALKWNSSHCMVITPYAYRKSVNPLLRPPGGLIYFNPIWGGGRGGGVNRDGGLHCIWKGGLFNSEQTMVSVLLKWKSSSTRRVEVLQPRIRIKSELPVGKSINHPVSVHTKFYSRDWLIQCIIS